MTIQPINSGLTVQRIYQYFCDSIISEDLKPGDMLPSEGQLAEAFNVGRGTVREAKKMLTAVGVFEERRGQGTFVATTVKPTMFNPLIFSLIIDSQSPENDGNKDIYELRVMYETAAMELVIDKATDNQIMQVVKCVEESIDSYKNGITDVNFYLQNEYQFHSKIYEITGNALIFRIGCVINDLFRTSMLKALKKENGIIACNDNHMRICKCLLSRDKQAIKAAILESNADLKNHASSTPF